MTTILCIRRYEDGSEMHCSDQITVHSRVWEELHRDHSGGSRPLFVSMAELGAEAGVVGRLVPSAGAASVALDTCIIPDWMWMALGAPEEMWVSLTPTDIPDAGSIRLKPHDARILEALDNPLEVLSAALSGSSGGPSWACLCAGAELPLAFGTFYVVSIESVEGYPVPAACILNLDVNLELDEADEPVRRMPTPIPEEPMVLTPISEFEPPSGVMWFAGMEKIVGCKR